MWDKRQRGACLLCRKNCDKSIPVCDKGSSDRKGAPMSERIKARLSQPLAEFVERMVGEAGLYETPSEYVRDLIRRDMERRAGQFVQDAVLAGYRDRNAALDLRRIHARSRGEWGDDVADHLRN
jgi:Arc/MetJ-type ribon-helix-helix transcriptional regulator